MVDPFVTEIGVGVMKAANEQRYLSVQLFGRPRALQYKFTIRNIASETASYSQSGRQHSLPPRTEVQHTECNPSTLSFSGIPKANQTGGGSAKFATRDGDVFILRTDRRGAVVVEHRPRVR